MVAIAIYLKLPPLSDNINSNHKEPVDEFSQLVKKVSYVCIVSYDPYVDSEADNQIVKSSQCSLYNESPITAFHLLPLFKNTV
tara:strand:- start:1145 stop:1393 length:249 start_codon:yes stop_codon:yes gene_type:complete